MGSSISSRIGAVRDAAAGMPHFAGGPDGRGGRAKRVLAVAAGLAIVLVLLPSTITYINPGHVGIEIHRAGGGVDAKPMGPGLHLRNPLLTSIEEYPYSG